jgi:hypothetical protein
MGPEVWSDAPYPVGGLTEVLKETRSTPNVKTSPM